MRVIKNARLRTVLRYLVPFVLIPAVIAAGIWFIEQKYHIFITIAVLMLSLLLFLCGFERRVVGVRRQVIVAVMVALSVAGRFIPFFKPITALTTITGMYLGGEAAFLVGALSAVISNFFYGQGPWTPFQMLAWGLIGLFAGFLAPLLKKSRVALLLFGVLSGVAYSAMMDIWTAISGEGFSLPVYLAALVTAIPHTVMYAVSNVIFLLLCARPFGNKLERVKKKYGV
ncbi:MAG: ECF transporter S component [Clostridia bacterium]|nr:ECF transporter S component [Clostridia bacterium]